MNWGAWLGTVLAVSFVFMLLSLIGFMAYHQGHLQEFRDGVAKYKEINEKYKKLSKS